MAITLNYSNLPVVGTLEFSYDSSTDILRCWAKFTIPGKGDEVEEYVSENEVVSEVSRDFFEFKHFVRFNRPSTINVRGYRNKWSQEPDYISSVIGRFFRVEKAEVRKEILKIG